MPAMNLQSRTFPAVPMRYFHAFEEDYVSTRGNFFIYLTERMEFYWRL